MRLRTIGLCATLLVAALAFGSGQALAAGGKISGRIVDAASRLPLGGVSVVTAGSITRRTETAADGSFELKNLLPGSYILITGLAGYETAQSDPIAVQDGMDQFVTLALAKDAVNAATTTGPNLTIPPPLFTYSGDVRAFYFGRTNGNNCLSCKTKGTPNAIAYNFGSLLHGQINVPHTPFALGATYFGAYPFGTNGPGPLGNIGYNPLVDNTLPGYSLSLFGEAYVQYKSAGLFAQTGREIVTSQQSPWTNASDSRITPEAFQGTLINGNPTTNLNLGGMYMTRMRSRVTSSFDDDTLLTSCNTANNTGKGPVAGVGGVFGVPGDPCNKHKHSQGFLQFSASYKFGGSGLVASAYQYQVYDIATMTWLTAQWNFNRAARANPFLAGQFLTEGSSGQALVGTIHNHTYGAQFSATVARNLNLAIGYNYSPSVAYVVAAAACKGSVFSPQSAATGAIFGGVADTSAKGLPAGSVLCYGGGLASPYTDNEATDPLYSTQISQGPADVHKPGTGSKAALTWTSNDKRIRLIVSNAWYNYGLPGFSGKVSNGDARDEFNADATYFFNPVRSGPYKGFSIRQRYADRTQPNSPFDFKYSRTQLEYTF